MTDLLADYERDGFAIVRGVMPASVTDAARRAVGTGTIVVVDSEGQRQELNVWTDCGDDLLGLVPRCDTMVDMAERAIGEPVGHWHSKISWKRPGSAGTWDWHQDYGFWLEEGCARPAMTTVSIALDRQDASNGCLRVIPGSHRAGDIPHPSIGAGRGADPDRVAELIDVHGMVDLELEPGDLVVFHCRTLHGSGPNHSDRHRAILHCSYNALTNVPSNPFFPGHVTTPIERVADRRVFEGSWSAVVADSRLIPAAENGYVNEGYTVLDG